MPAPRQPYERYLRSTDELIASMTRSSKQLREFALGDDAVLVEAAARNTATAPEVLRAIFDGSSNPLDYGASLAANGSTPSDILECLAHHEALQGDVAGNKNTSSGTLRWMALLRIEDTKARTTRIRTLRRVARHPSTPLEIVERWETHEVREIREGVAANSQIDLAMLERLARDPAATVRRVTAARERLSPATLVILSGDSSNTVRKAVAGNPKTPKETLALLVNDPAGVVRSEAKPVLDRFVSELGIDKENTSAKEYVLSQAWWAMTPQSPEVMLALALSPNA